MEALAVGIMLLAIGQMLSFGLLYFPAKMLAKTYALPFSWRGLFAIVLCWHILLSPLYSLLLIIIGYTQGQKGGFP